MANFFLRNIDEEAFREARGYCLQRGMRLVDLINDYIRTWNAEQRKQLRTAPQGKKGATK